MATVKLTEVVHYFVDVGEWLEKLELVAKFKDLKNLETVIPMFLEGVE